MKVIGFLILRGFLITFSALDTSVMAKDAPPIGYPVGYLIAHLDVTSFPSSIHPRSSAGKRTFADYGFFPVMMSSDEAVLETTEHDWRFEVHILGSNQNTITVCLHDQAMNGGSYDAQQILLIRSTEGSTYLTGETFRARDKRCPAFAK
jgi:hypothetical protein